MDLNEHIAWQRDFDSRHGWTCETADDSETLRLVTLDVVGLASELGELSHHVKYCNMDASPLEAKRESISKELVDILIYCFRIFGHLMRGKRFENEEKFKKYEK
jgi:hypothetical protein